MDLRGKRTLVVGLGESGLAMARWLARQGAVVRVADSRETSPRTAALRTAVPEATLFAGQFAPAAFAGVELIAISPGVSRQEPLVQKAVALGVPVVSEIELFACGLRQWSPQAQVIAITGSNGKTTTTALTGALCRAAGRSTAVAGNIGPAALDALMHAIDHNEPPVVWVLELSSFQLEATQTLAAAAATLLNISEDHLDRYNGLDDYANSKMRIFQGGGVMVLNRDDARSLAAASDEREVVTFGLNPPTRRSDYGLVDACIVRGGEQLVKLADLKLVGRHNAANAMAALALCAAIGIEPRSVLPALKAFGGLSHRVEWVAEINGVSYFDDSKGTNVGATLAAIQGLGRPLAIILGGDGKGQDFSPLKTAIDQHARAAALIGRDAPAIAAALQDCRVPWQYCTDMAAAVRWCATHTQIGDAVLLSPACASMDMYRDYAHRAEAFIAAVRAIEKEAA
ncbi:MAG TPA: UDP-N-acetylmuramoyl-L-alanine--D-glutamate ligase [Accumulibacter sp.]|uniref:UDP-N-acetylmuramoylalanine--D-glutamate ligase n=1 Tax=Candidatus Accumulibacter phosphatis TaxID=327160 RepID=A0A5S4ES56_9PROT|nr:MULTISPECIES: UDP-N-acetylmuramoyl-L-alanine--D-glutamate ligase [Candidatus Accumulibacter]MBL8399936.1 UDP-N-acetylmuramoyl-L-alanine--D-glutamate ligase [Accumulibacter sp.]MBN8516365.1 UDP-N-acetylmuramoyl-L-alanine--D-glutamate ligase [Accumulibacter sp.]MBO3712390.1 UDP-N-acetylmuramoyl-L-alanine--D-glutamate ligase [Accumulibacter sp.]MCC2867571.1 UDP-N-acetylmuramoyl-L-alanine--D-glutamate ligase [Candidatus Accumulibacter phosphatis]MCM8579950.1 UDP-N-acetylmuramoyl-L-alanine--D-gl